MSSTDRLVRLEGATNFRDLGGYRGRDGRAVRWRRIFRSDHLCALTAADLQTLHLLGLQRAFDFRGAQERAAAAYELPGLRQHSLAIEPTLAQRMAELVQSGIELDAAHMSQLMHELYLRLIDESADRYAEWFEHLLHDDAPFVFHCTAGKDRTGVAAALLLLALGVSRDTVEHDFLLTNVHYRRPAALSASAAAIPEDAMAVLWSVQAGFLQTCLAAIETRMGSVDAYLQAQLGLTPAARHRLASLYLEG